MVSIPSTAGHTRIGGTDRRLTRRYGMNSSPTRKAVVATAALAALALPLAACSGGAGSSSSGGKVQISYLTQNDTANTAQGKALIQAFEKKYPNITVKMDTQPGGTQGDNLMKTKLSTGSMDDVFHYNSGSLFQALNPKTTMADLSNES